MATYDVTGASAASASSDGSADLIRDLTASASSAIVTSAVTPERISDVTVASSAIVTSALTDERLVEESAESSAIALSSASIAMIVDAIAASSAIAYSAARYDSEELEVWSINSATKAAGKYVNFDFNSFARIGGRLFGFGDGGVFEIIGSTDDGSPIGIFMQSGTLREDSGRMMTHKAYVVGNLPDGVLDKLDMFIMDDYDERYDYPIDMTEGRLDSSPITLGKGIRTRHLRYGVSGSINAPLELSSLMIVVGQSARNE